MKERSAGAEKSPKFIPYSAKGAVSTANLFLPEDQQVKSARELTDSQIQFVAKQRAEQQVHQLATQLPAIRQPNTKYPSYEGLIQKEVLALTAARDKSKEALYRYKNSFKKNEDKDLRGYNDAVLAVADQQVREGIKPIGENKQEAILSALRIEQAKIKGGKNPKVLFDQSSRYAPTIGSYLNNMPITPHAVEEYKGLFPNKNIIERNRFGIIGTKLPTYWINFTHRLSSISRFWPSSTRQSAPEPARV